MKVSQLMNKAVIVDDNVSLKEAGKIMSSKNLTSLIIVKDDKIFGILTDRDVLKNISDLDQTVAKGMSKNVITITDDASVEDAAKLMMSKNVKRLPVVKKGKLVGAINLTDIIGSIEGENDDFFLN